MKKTKLLSFLLAAAVLAVPLAGCSQDDAGDTGSGASGDTVKIGGLAPLTGDVSQYGIAVRNAILMAVEDINEAGGILGGRQIEFICEDEKGDATEATTAYTKLVDNDGIVALLGDVTSAPCKAVAARAAADNLPMLTPSGTDAEITTIGENVFRTCFIDPYQGQLMANYAAKKLGAKTAAVLYDSGDSYSTGIANAFVEAAKEEGMTITNQEGYASGSTDFNSQLTKIKSSNPDVLLLPVYYSDVALIVSQIKQQNITSTLLGADGWDGVAAKLDATTKDVVADKAYFCSQYSAVSDDPELQAFLTEYKERYGEDANMFAVLGYDSMHIMAEAIDKAGSTDSDAIIQALGETNYDGLTGTTKFNDQRNPVREAIITSFDENGAYKVIESYTMQ